MEAAAPLVEHWWAIAWLATVSGMCLAAAIFGRATAREQRYRPTATVSGRPTAQRPGLAVVHRGLASRPTASRPWSDLATLPTSQHDHRLRSLCDALDAVEVALTRSARKLWRKGDTPSPRVPTCQRLTLVRSTRPRPTTTRRAA